MAKSGSTIASMNGKPRELNNAGTSTSEVVFTTDGTTAVVTPLPPGQLTGASGATTGGASNFQVVAYGRVVTAGSYLFNAQLYYGTSTTVASNTSISSPISLSLASLTTNWKIVADCCYDGDSQRLICQTATAIHTSTYQVGGSITGITSNNTTLQGFVVTGTFGTGNASNKAYLDGLDILE